MDRTVTLNKDNMLTVVEDGKETVLSPEQTAAFFDPPESPQFFYTVYLFKTKPQEAKIWVYLKLQQLQFIKTYLEIQKKKDE